MKYVVYYGGKDIDEFEAESEEEAISYARESEAFTAQEAEEDWQANNLPEAEE